MVHGDFAKQLGLLKLRLKNVLLVAQARAVACVRRFLDLLEEFSVAPKYSQRLGQIGKPEVCRFDSHKDRAAYGLVLLLHDVGISLRYLPPKAQFSRVRKILRDAEAEVSEVAVCKTCKGSRASYIDLLQSELRIGKRGDLCRYLLRRLPGAACRL